MLLLKLPNWALGAKIQLIETHANIFKIPLEAAVALVDVESSGKEWAYRFEPGYRYTTHVHSYANELQWSYYSEEVCQKSSFGLTQIMGSVAREYGHQDELTQLFDMDKNLHYGFKHYRSKLDKYFNTTDAYAAYNAGSVRKTAGGLYVNEHQVTKFIQKLDEIKNLIQ